MFNENIDGSLKKSPNLSRFEYNEFRVKVRPPRVRTLGGLLLPVTKLVRPMPSVGSDRNTHVTP
jgi:hypothetical protein